MRKWIVASVVLLSVMTGTTWTRGQTTGPASATSRRAEAGRIELTEEKLPNGLRVIYAPLHQAPVVHVRVLYHVGSRDERPDRQGFAHMFEHMMFRGSEHVKPEEHMKLIGVVGGYSNAFTSFDQTVYVNTVPANFLEMALYLEADRMASFKVSDSIYKTERDVVQKEWGMRQNQPYGTTIDDFMALAFQKHPYRWTPIGNMEHLQAADSSELQAFFNTYYVPNNAVLVIAGDIEVDKAKALVGKYFQWIPAGTPVKRDFPAEPQQTAARREVKQEAVPLPSITLGYKIPPFRSDDHYPLSLLATILSGGRSGRLDAALVNNDDPLCTTVSAGPWQLEDGGIFMVTARLMAGKKVEEAERVIHDQMRQVIDKPVSAEELAKAKLAARKDWAKGREDAESIASQVGEQALFADDPERVNTELAKLEAVSAADIQRVARQYLQDERASTLVVLPGGGPASRPTTAPASQAAPVPVATAPRPLHFPQDWPTKAPMSQEVLKATFEKGVETTIDNVKVIVMSDHRLPLVSWSLTMRRGSHLAPPDKTGLGWLTAEMVRRGPQGSSFQEFNELLESQGISLEVSDGGDYTRISGSSMSGQLAEGLVQTRRLLRSPLFSPVEFGNLRQQLINVLRQQQANAASVAGNELNAAVFGDSPLGRYATPQSLAGITLEEVKDYFTRTYIPDGAILMIAGDVSVEQGQSLARQVLAEWQIPVQHAQASYDFPPIPQQRRIIVVDRPEGRQSTVRMAVRAYDIHSDEKFAGSVANQILTAGIDSRLGQAVRAQQGLAYSVHGVFQPKRHGGAFQAATDTEPASAARAVELMFRVFEEMAQTEVKAEELAEAKMRVTGSMVMSLQDIDQQASMRVEGILNGYPIDYYDKYPERIAGVTAEQVKAVMAKYVKPQSMTLVVVAPAEAVKPSLEKLGEVKVVPMPAQRKTAPSTQPVTTQPAATRDAA